MVAKKPAKKKKTRAVAEEHPFVKVTAQLREAEKSCRAKFQSVSGYEITRKMDDEEKGFRDLMKELQVVEEHMVDVISNLEPHEVGDHVEQLISLLDAGGAGFFAGTRGRAAGVLVQTAARKALCRKQTEEEEEEDEDQVSTSTETNSHQTESPRDERGGDAAASSQSTVADLVAAYVDAGLVVLCYQLWRPARDGDHKTLAQLLARDPYTVDEPGRAGQGFTNALQVACAGGHVECVQLLIKHGAVFRDADWQSPPRPFVCASMLTGAGYFDGGGAPRGILFFQSASLPKRRIARDTYIFIIDLLLAQATFCEDNADREMLGNTRFAMLNVDPPAPAEDVTILPAWVPPPDPTAAHGDSKVSGATPRYGVGGATPRDKVGGATPRDKVGGATPRDKVGGATPRYGQPMVGGATPRLGRGVSSPGKVGSNTPREKGVGGATPRYGVGASTPRIGRGVTSPAKVGGATPREKSVGGATPRLGRGVSAPGKVSSATPRDGVSRATPRVASRCGA